MRARSIAILLAFSPTPALAQTIPAAVITDPAPDKEHPAAMHVAAIQSHGSKMNGVLYVASGAGPHPALLLLHGLPGNEQNLDLAQAARRAGWNVLTMHYRGSWGSKASDKGRAALVDAMAGNMESLAGCTAQSLAEDAFEHAEVWDPRPVAQERPAVGTRSPGVGERAGFEDSASHG